MKNNYDNRRIRMFYLILLLLPFLTIVFLLVINGHRLNTSIFMPGAYVNDELGWWQQTKAILEYGRPLGYYGYNETHAQIGTFGPWGIAPLIPYAIFGRIFGWKYNSIVIANSLYLGIALLIFCFLVQATYRQVLKLGLLYLCSFVTVGYSLTSMAEGSRYAIGIVLIGILTLLRERRTKHVNKKALLNGLIVFFLLYSINVYEAFALIAPLFLWFMAEGVRYKLRIPLCIFGTLTITLLSNILISHVSAPYVVSTIGDIIQCLKTEGISNAFCLFVRTALGNIRTVSLASIMNMQERWLKWFYLEYILLSFFFIGRTILQVKESRTSAYVNRESVIDVLVPSYILIVFLFGYCALYTGSHHTLCRGTNTGLLMSFCWCAVYPKTSKQMKRTLLLERTVGIILGLTVVGAVSIGQLYQSFIHSNAVTSNYITVIESEEERLSHYIEISKEKLAWENTIAIYGIEDSLLLALPAGAGINLMVNQEACEKAGYAVFEKAVNNKADRDLWTSQLLDKGYSIIINDDFYTVFSKKHDR